MEVPSIVAQTDLDEFVDFSDKQIVDIPVP